MGKELAVEWLKASYSDIVLIEEIIDNDFLTHLVAFHSQQAIEKSFKALLENSGVRIPKVHKLQNLISMLDIKIEISLDTLKILDELYIDSRYPSAFGLLPYGKPTLKDAETFYAFAQSIFEYVCQTLDVNNQDLRK
ncbi:HEPN domain-containing protein [bacterium]|nr:HEPN domain-containing protein [bacterium]MBU1958472.1 HEPN domain-containing protein [bacterium]